MPYAAPADIEAIYGADTLARVADRDFDGVADVAAVETALQRATDEIDAHLAARYELPLASVPPVLVQLCVDIALYRLAQSGAVRTDEDRTRYEDAIDLLGRIAAGKAALPLPPSGDPDDPTADQGPRPIVTSGPERVFTREKMRGL